MNQNHRFVHPLALLHERPQAWAKLRGSSLCPGIFGIVRFYRHPNGTLVSAEVRGIPENRNACASPILGFHIHEGTSCSGNEEDPFADARMHYNPGGCPHPYHAGDLPPLINANGYALSVFLTDRFNINEIIGKTVILHDSTDDFSTQPSGNSGKKIACGEIVGHMYRR